MWPRSWSHCGGRRPASRTAASRFRMIVFGFVLLFFLTAGELRVDAGVIERTSQDRDDDRASGRAASPVVEIAALHCRDKPDDQPDRQNDGAESHGRLNFLLLPYPG